MWVAFVCAFLVLRAEFQRRHLAADPQTIAVTVALAGIAGAKLYNVLETPADLAANPVGMIFSRSGFAWAGGLIAGVIALAALARHYRIPLLLMLDACAPAAALGYAVGRIGCLISGDGDYGIPTSLPWAMSFPHGLVPTTQRVHPTPIYEFLAGMVIFFYLWKLGARALRGPRPQGEVVAAYFLWTGLARFLVEFIRRNPRSFFGLTNAQAISLASMAAGVVLLAVIRQRHRKKKNEHRILRHISDQGDVLQPEYHRATPECPQPARWRMYDSMTAEYEVLEFLRCLITTVKPKLVVETGTFSAVSTLWIAEGLKINGWGKVITCESDAAVFASAQQRISASGLAEWIECRNQSSLEMEVEGTVDVLFSDSDLPLREQEVRRFLPQMNPHGLILMHDASSHLKIVREAALRLEAEGLISVVLLPTPRGLVIAQKRAGR